MGIGGSVFSIVAQLLITARYDGWLSEKVGERDIMGAAGKCFGSVIVPPVNLEAVPIMENKLVGYAGDSTLNAVVPLPVVRVAAIAESHNHDFIKVSEWCDHLMMKLNESKIKTMIVTWSRTIHFQSPTLTLGGTVQKKSDLNLL